jgi:hypothetical protein
LGSELAINITDGKLFYKDNANAVQVIGWKVVPATAGGTGQTSYAVGDLLYADTTTSLAKLTDVATGNALISGGVGVAPAWGKIGLTTHVTGTLPVANGGTGTTTAFTVGSVVFAGTSGVYSQDNANLFWDDTNNRLGIGTATPATQFDVANASGRNVRIGGFQFGGTSATADAGNNLLSSGAYWNGTNFTATATSAATMQLGNGVVNFYADTGLTAGNTFALTTKFSVAAAGDATLSTGNLVIGTSGKGIDFSATPGTGTSELLADYEEGTWTPVITCGTPGNLTIVYDSQVGYYTKVGRQVTVTFSLSTTTFTHTTASGIVFISGLPFTIGLLNMDAIGAFQGFTSAGFTQMGVQSGAATSNLYIVISGSGQTLTNAAIGTFPTGTVKKLYGVVSYFV